MASPFLVKLKARPDRTRSLRVGEVQRSILRPCSCFGLMASDVVAAMRGQLLLERTECE